MLLTVFCAPRDSSETTFALDVSPDLELRDFVALCELESGIPAGEIQIIYAEQPLQDPTRSLGTYGLKDGDVLVLRQAERRPPVQPSLPGLPRIDFSSIAVPGTSSNRSSRRPQSAQAPTNTTQQRPAPAPAAAAAPAAGSPQGLDDPMLLRDMLLANPHELSLLKERNPPLAEALLSGDLERFTKVLQEQQQDRARREQERIRLLTADPFDLDAQAKIEEDIRQHNIEENMNIAMEEAPESFGQVVMLYINCKVNGHPVKAFVDSGAQMTIMSQACAERCNIMRLVDRRWAGIAKGVGTQKIIGRVHLAQVQIEGDFLPCSFSILEDQPMDMLLGLDMLKRHQCSIDLKKSVLLIGTTGSETRFLPEGELPECARLAYGPEGRDEPRPEEIADRELAEAIQRSVQESVDTEDGQTTSSRSAPKLFYKPFNKAPSPSPSTSGGQARVLDRSQSAPTPLPPTHVPESSSTNLDSPLAPSGAEGSAPLQPVQEKPPPLAPSTSSLQESQCSSVPSSSQPVPPPVPSKPPEMQDSVPSVRKERHSPGPSSLPDSHPSPEPCLETSDPASPSSSPSQEPWLASASRQKAASVTVEDMDSQADVDNLEHGSSAASEPGESCGSEKPHGLPPQESVPQEMGSSKTCAPKRTCSPPPDEGRDAGGKRSPLPVPSDANASVDPPGLVKPSCAPSKQLTPEETMEESEGADDLERDQPEGGSCSSSSSNGNGSGSSSNGNGSNNIPSLAQALKELHQLLVSNRALSPPSCRLDADGLDQQTPSDRSPPPPPSVQGTSADETLPPCPPETENWHNADSLASAAEPADASEREGAVGCRPDAGDCDDRDGWSETGEALPPEEDMTEREPPEGQQGRGEADGRDSGVDAPVAPDAPDTPHQPSDQPGQESPLSLAVGSSSEQPAGSCPHSSVTTPPLTSSPPPPAPPAEAPASALAPIPATPPVAERFPAADIQRIQAAGFSAQEAADALEQAQGCVELALLVLLARKISVPT